MDDLPKPADQPIDVSRDELLFDLEVGMRYLGGKARQRAAVDAAVVTVAHMIAAHVDRAGFISASGQQVEGGVKLVGETGQVLSDISSQVAKLANVVTDIAAATQEQTSGLASVNATVDQMDQVTQRNAALVEQAAAATATLSQEANQLKQLASRFQVSESAAKPRGSYRALEVANS